MAGARSIADKDLTIQQKDGEIDRRNSELLKINSNINELEYMEKFIRRNITGAPESELSKLNLFVKTKDPQFYERMIELKSKLGLSSRDFNDTLLIRLGISLKICASILDCNPAALGVQRKRLITRIEDKRGETKWEEYIRSFSFSSR